MGKYFTKIKKIMGVAMERGLHKNEAFRKFKIEKKPGTEPIYLTKEEVLKIRDLDLSDLPHLDRERDRFLLSVFWLLRFGESTQIRETLIYQSNGKEYIRTSRLKKGKDSVNPVDYASKEILKKWNFNFSEDTNQEANRKIKTICRMAGIDQEISNGKKIAPKYKFVTTHTARRTGATLSHKNGIPLYVIQKQGGWKNLKQLQRYLRIGDEESADSVRELIFF